MEVQFDKRLDELMEVPGVVGALVTDKQGLCVGVRGKAVQDSSGYLTNVSQKATQIEPSNEEQPVILFDSSNMQCMIQRDENITLAIFKTMNS